jgi:SAM-dependent methyltransferase
VDVEHDPAPAAYRAARVAHWNALAATRSRMGGSYHRWLQRVYAWLIPPGARVLELGCGQGDLLAAVKPSRGVGVDFSPDMLEAARRRHPALELVLADVHDLGRIRGPFDAVILSDLLNDVWDVQTVLEQLHRLIQPGTRVIINSYSRLWELPLRLAESLHLALPQRQQNWLTTEDISNLLRLSGFETIRRWPEVLLPLPVPLLAGLCNRLLARLWPFRYFTLSNFVLAAPAARPLAPEPSVTVVVPARNEAGNIDAILHRVPEMGAGTEIIFVEGGSSDGTREAIESAIAAHPERRCRLLGQTGRGKGDAVRLGFEQARGEILMILDADLTVPPEDLPRVFHIIVSGLGEFVNGVRLVYPMEKEAMRFANLIGNKFFSLAFSWLLGQPVKDSLCGTKALSRDNYTRIAAGRSYFGDFDPFGDFDLLFGAARLGLRIVDLPIRYRERTYGTTNIQRWRHGLLLLRMCAFAARRIKFF